MAGASHVDFRLVGKPANFEGAEAKWPEWAFQMRAYIVLSELFSRDTLDEFENRRGPVDATEWEEARRRKNETLYYLLCMVCKGTAQVLIRRCPVGHGAEAWRCLVRRYENRDAMSSMSVFQAILSFDFGTSIDAVMGRLMEYETLINRYEDEVEPETLGDDIRKAVLIRGVPEPLIFCR